tara:strand:+ start:41646 stop:41969 length:324 start_codon:yes stop_codon:yes gene_type:complete
MKTITAILGLVLISSTALAGECTQQKARDAANAFFNKRNQGNKVFVTSAQGQKVVIGDKELEGNLKMQFSVDGGGVMAEIGEIELHPGTCEVVNLNSSSALSTTFEP